MLQKIVPVNPVILFLLACPLALSGDLQRQDQLVWDFAEFSEAFSTRNWPGVARFVRPESKMGFGGEMGMDGLMQVFGEDDTCHEAMVRALQLGCKKTGEGSNMRCVAPPQLGPDVVYLGARASFKFDADAEIWMAEFLICGGD